MPSPSTTTEETTDDYISTTEFVPGAVLVVKFTCQQVKLWIVGELFHEQKNVLERYRTFQISLTENIFTVQRTGF